jgi:hypothetical protein
MTIGLRTLILSSFVVLFLLCGIPSEAGNGEWKEHESKHYLLQTQCDDGVAKQILQRIEVMYKFYADVYKYKGKPDKKATLKIYRNQQAFMQATGEDGGTGAFYNTMTKELVGYWTNGTDRFWNFFFHEGNHQFFDLSFPGFYTSGDIPMWFSEGFADCFGASTYSRGRIMINQTSTELGALRMEDAKMLVAQGKYVPFETLFQMGNEEFIRSPIYDYLYGQCWSVCHFLWSYPQIKGEKGQYRKVLFTLIEEFKKGTSKDEAYKKAFVYRGKPIDLQKLEAEWKAWVPSLR